MDREMIAQTLIQLNQYAMHEIREKNYRKAADYFTQSLVLERNLGLKQQTAESFYNLAMTFYLLEDYEKALEKLNMAEMIFNDLNKKEDITKVQIMMSEIQQKNR